MLAAVASGCELDSRSVERIVEHSAIPEREMLPHSPLIRNEKQRVGNGFRPCQSLNSPNAYQSGASSSSSTERAGSYHIQTGRNGDSLCGSEHYTDSGIHQTESNHLDDDHRLIQDEREARHLLSQEQQFGTFGRPGTMIANHHRATLPPQYEQRHGNGMTTAGNQSEESLQPIFHSSNTFPTKKHAPSDNSLKRSYSATRPFCPDWRCVLMCNMIIMSLLVVIFLSGYYYIWPVYVIPLVEASKPIDGGWTAFQPWSACSKTCGPNGSQTRRRFCGNPAPEDGGLDCMGNSTEVRSCRAELDCPDCSRVCKKGTLNDDCTKCTCEHHVITGSVTDDSGNPLVNAFVYKLGHYDKLAETDRQGQFKITKICAEGDNALQVTKVGFNPISIIPDKVTPESATGIAKLKMLITPKITTIPEDKVRYEGQSVKLCCQASDNDGSSLLVRWYKNKKLIVPGELYNGTSTDLIIRDLSLKDSGMYQCKATNPAGSDMTGEIKLKVKPLVDEPCNKTPIVKMQPLDNNGACDHNEVNVGECVGETGAANSKCLHKDAFREVVEGLEKTCKDPKSDYCCGPVTYERIEISCRAPSPNQKTAVTYKIPVQTIKECGCTKC